MIKSLYSRIVKDSSGKDTIETVMEMSEGAVFKASVPTGTSIGTGEAKALTPHEAVVIVNTKIKNAVSGLEIKDIYTFDRRLVELDGSNDKHNLGANSILSCSICAIRFLAHSQNLPLWKYISLTASLPVAIPEPMMVMIEGGKHGSFPQVSWQEYLLNSSVANGKVFITALKKELEKRRVEYREGLEGGLSINLESNQKALDLFLLIFNSLKGKKSFSIDFAASHLADIDDKTIARLADHPSLASIEDPATEDDFEKWRSLSKNYGDKIKIIADDLTTTNPSRLESAIQNKVCNGVIVKPNQIGSVSETLDFVRLAKSANLSCVVSHRSRETKDDFIVSLAVGVGADYLKAGAPTQPERLAKYNRLAQIGKEIGGSWKTTTPNRSA